MDNTNHQSPIESPRPGIGAAAILMIIAFIGLWLSGIIVIAIAPEDSGWIDTIHAIVYYALFIGLPIVVYMRRHPGMQDAMRLKPLPVLPVITVILLALLSVYAVIALDALWVSLLDGLGLRQPEAELSLESGGALKWAIFTSAAIPGFCEELLFRGVVFPAWERRGTVPAIAVSAALFMLLHANLYGFPAYLLIGAISAFTVFALDSLYAGMIYHMVYNAAILVLAFQVSRIEVPEGAAADVSMLSVATELAIMLALMAWMIVHLNRRRLAAGIEAKPRIKAALRKSEWIPTVVAAALMVIVTILVMAGV